MDLIRDQWQLILTEFPTFLAVAVAAAGGVAWVLNHRYSGTIETLRERNAILTQQRDEGRAEVSTVRDESSDLRAALGELEQRLQETTEDLDAELAKRPLPLIGYGPPPDGPMQDGQLYFQIAEPSLSDDQHQVLGYLAEHPTDAHWAKFIAEALGIGLVRVQHAIDGLRDTKMVKRHSNVGSDDSYTLAPAGRAHLVRKGLVE